MDGWKIALFGTNQYYEIADDSTVDLSTLGVTNPMTDDSWLKFYIKGMSPHKEPYGENEERIGGIQVHNPAQIQTFEIEFIPFVFPDDMDQYEGLFALLRNKYIYLFKGEYNFTNWSIHPDGKAIRISAMPSTEDDYENGIKVVKIKARKEKPVV
ncbi:MAG: hypothetical protein CH6_0001 [Candidatus Kapaibacterium sp.]|nr:MAG: hypothetical protein CH6_0001 [Candidatus Kapabacteria bacterium]